MLAYDYREAKDALLGASILCCSTDCCCSGLYGHSRCGCWCCEDLVYCVLDSFPRIAHRPLCGKRTPVVLGWHESGGMSRPCTHSWMSRLSRLSIRLPKQGESSRAQSVFRRSAGSPLAVRGWRSSARWRKPGPSGSRRKRAQSKLSHDLEQSAFLHRTGGVVIVSLLNYGQVRASGSQLAAGSSPPGSIALAAGKE